MVYLLLLLEAYIVDCFDNLQDLAGASIVVGVAANLALDAVNKILKGNLDRPIEERHQEAWNDSVSLFLSSLQVGLIGSPKPERLMLIGRIVFVTISLFLQSACELTEPVLMSLATANIFAL